MSHGPRTRGGRGLRLLLGLLVVALLAWVAVSVVVAMRIEARALEVRSPADDGLEPQAPLTETVRFPTGRGELPALFADGRSSTWAVLVHGKGTTPAEMLPMARGTTAAGLPTLSISYRNDTGVPADPDGRYTYGRTEWRDLDAAVAYAQAKGAEAVVLGGSSMGGSIVASYLREAERRPGLVRGVVLDAPVLDLRATVREGARQLDLPLGLRLPSPLLATAEAVDSLAFGVDWGAADYLDDTSWLRVPALVVHTTGDRTVPLATSRALADAEPDLVRLETFPGGHVQARVTEPERYVRLVRDFVSRLPQPS